MYFSATVFTTVGFDDITAKSEEARAEPLDPDSLRSAVLWIQPAIDSPSRSTNRSAASRSRGRPLWRSQASAAVSPETIRWAQTVLLRRSTPVRHRFWPPGRVHWPPTTVPVSTVGADLISTPSGASRSNYAKQGRTDRCGGCALRETAGAHRWRSSAARFTALPRPASACRWSPSVLNPGLARVPCAPGDRIV